MDQRKGDPRVYIVIFLFLSCIVLGGVFLGLYLLHTDPNPLFLQVGMFFVGIPWFFWFLTYVYSCLLKPCTFSLTKNFSVDKSVSNFDLEKGEQNTTTTNNVSETATPTTDPVVTAAATPREGEKRVQFGEVVVLGDEDEQEDGNEGNSNHLIQNHNHIRIEEQEKQENGRLKSRTDDDDESSDDEDCDKTPLRLSVGNKRPETG